VSAAGPRDAGVSVSLWTALMDLLSLRRRTGNESALDVLSRAAAVMLECSGAAVQPGNTIHYHCCCCRVHQLLQPARPARDHGRRLTAAPAAHPDLRVCRDV